MGTFQEYYTQAELKAYLESQLGVEAIAATLTVYHLFKDESLQQQVLAKRYRRAPAPPRKSFSELKFDENRDLLEPFLCRVLELGRLPEGDEYDGWQAVAERFGSVRRALALLKRVTRLPGWAEIRRQRTDDLLAYLALARFRKRPPISKLPPTLRRDIKEFFGTYKRARQLADALLFAAGDAAAIDAACRRSPLGKLLPNALYVHRCGLDRLDRHRAGGGGRGVTGTWQGGGGGGRGPTVAVDHRPDRHRAGGGGRGVTGTWQGGGGGGRGPNCSCQSSPRPAQGRWWRTRRDRHREGGGGGRTRVRL